jgi:hypothetical protein
MIMKKEILLKVVVDDNKIGYAIQKNGFEKSLSSSFEVLGILSKVLKDEQEKVEKSLNTETDCKIRESMDGTEYFIN